MKILLIGNVSCHAVRRLREEFEKNGAYFDAISPKDIVFGVFQNEVIVHTREGRDLFDHDVFIFRGMGKFAHELSVIARYLHHKGKVIIEEELATRGATFDKLTPCVLGSGVSVLDYQLLFAHNTTQSLDYDYPVVVKSVIGSKGKGVFLVKDPQELEQAFERTGFPVIVQKYVPIEYDYRVMIVGEKVIGVMKRYNSNGGFLTVQPGGRREPASLPQDVIDRLLLAKKIIGLEIVGIDVLEYGGEFYKLEVNMSPQFRVFERVVGVNVAEEIVAYVTEKYENSTNKKEG